MSAIWTPPSVRRSPVRPLAAPGPETTHLMSYHDKTDATAVWLTKMLQSKDHLTFGVRNKRVERYEIWRRNPNGSTTMILRMEDDQGGYVDPKVFVNQLFADLAAMEEDPAAKVARIEAENQKIKDDAMKSDCDQIAAEGEYFRKRVSQELDGHAVRHTEEDAVKGLKSRWV